MGCNVIHVKMGVPISVISQQSQYFTKHKEQHFVIPAESKLCKGLYHQRSNQSNRFAAVSKQPEETNMNFIGLSDNKFSEFPNKSRLKETKDRQHLPGHEADF
jgi:hypothetical protein